jgi:hypothetical protein
MEADRITASLKDRTLQIVAEKNASDAAQSVEGIDVAAQEVRHRRTRKEAQKEPP